MTDEQMRIRIYRLHQALTLASKYLAKAVADGHMEGCVIPCSRALDSVLATLEHEPVLLPLYEQKDTQCYGTANGGVCNYHHTSRPHDYTGAFLD